ncbi:MAG TPA: sodium:solute symporter [Bacillota bacterium]|nr:sodium:solute symporter [Bacillota bacterium]HPT66581.1 sodium:solute symporter [Bacillota bacterium]
MSTDLILRWSAIGLFVLVMIGIGFYSMRRTRNVSDFFLGGRNVGPWISAFAYGTTYFSAVLFIGYAGGQGFAFGLPVIWVALGNAFFGCLLAWLVLARKTRAMTEHLNVMTMPEFLEARYDSRLFKIVGALIIFIFMIPYSGSVFSGLSFLFVNVLNVDYGVALAFMTVLTAVYLLMGGYFAVALTDFIQGLVMLVGCVLMVAYVFGHSAVGGFAGFLTKMQTVDVNLVNLFPKGGINLFWLVVLTSLGSWGLPQMVQKFYAIKNQKVISTATVVGTIFCLIIGGAAYLVGSTTTLYGSRIVALEANANYFADSPDYAAAVTDPAVARQLIGSALKTKGSYANTNLIPQIMQITMPNGLLIIILLLVLSASMSTLSSLVLVSSSAITIDLLQGHFAPKMSKERGMSIMRLLCAAFIALSLLVASLSRKWPHLVALMSFSWGTVAGAFLAPYLYGLFWKGVTKVGAWAGLIAGVGYSMGTFIWYALDPARFAAVTSVAPRVGSLAMLIPLVVVPVVSWLTPKFSQAHLDRVFGSVQDAVADSEAA